MILFVILAALTSLIVAFLLGITDQKKHKNLAVFLLGGFPLISLSFYLWIGNPNIPSQSVAFEQNPAKRAIRLLNAQDPEELEKLRQKVLEKMVPDTR